MEIAWSLCFNVNCVLVLSFFIVDVIICKSTHLLYYYILNKTLNNQLHFRPLYVVLYFVALKSHSILAMLVLASLLTLLVILLLLVVNNYVHNQWRSEWLILYIVVYALQYYYSAYSTTISHPHSSSTTQYDGTNRIQDQIS